MLMLIGGAIGSFSSYSCLPVTTHCMPYINWLINLSTCEALSTETYNSYPIECLS